MEWEQEQLRRTGLRADELTEKAVKPTYKPAPSMSTTVVFFLLF